MKLRVCVVGLGKLGTCMAAVMAAAGHWVVGLDSNLDVVAKINRKVAPVDEPGLQKLISKVHQPLVATTHTDTAVLNSDIAFIVVPTPSLDDGGFDHSIVRDAALALAKSIGADAQRPYTIVISSTVMPGTCHKLQLEIDDVAGRHIPLVYSPEFIALGTVIKDMRYPDMVLVGCDDRDEAADFINVMRIVTCDSFETRYLPMSLIDAELAKISVNSYVTMKISFANQLAAICEGIPGGNARNILQAIGCDRRIGNAYLQPGGPFGGPCFPRDNAAFQRVATDAHAEAPLAEATDIINSDVIARIIGMIPQRGPVAVLGMTYKTDTPVTEQSLGSILTTVLPRRCKWHDPTSSSVDAQEVVDNCRYVILATPWDEYINLDYSGTKLVIDVWGVLPQHENIQRLGVGA